MTSDPILQAIRDISRALWVATDNAGQLADLRRNLIRLAIDAGRTVAAIAKVTGLTHGRISQLAAPKDDHESN